MEVRLKEDDVEFAKKFFRTKSAHAAARTAIGLAQTLIPYARDTAQGREIVVRDQVNGGDLRVIVAR